MKSGQLMRQVVNKINGVDFNTLADPQHFGAGPRASRRNQQCVGLQDENEGDAGLCGLSGRPLTVEGAHQHPEVEAGDMDQITLVQVFAALSLHDCEKSAKRAHLHLKEFVSCHPFIFRCSLSPQPPSP